MQGSVFCSPVLACSNNATSSNQVLTARCDSTTTIAATLAVGGYQIVDPLRQAPCVRLPGNSAAQEYAVLAYSAQGGEADAGIFGPFALLANSSTSLSGDVVPEMPIRSMDLVPGRTAAQFDRTLRLLERALVRDPSLRHPPLGAPPILSAPPVVGQRDSFFVCQTLTCAAFNRIGATVKSVGTSGVIYVDDHQAAGADTLTQVDFDQLEVLFDQYLYATDTTAFGRESDINGDQHVSILITPAVNALTPDCTNGRVIGYFFGNDLLPGARGSNSREMFYATSTSVSTSTCPALGRARALSLLPPTLIHEFQHMISFNQHVLLRAGSDQVLWANEGLSHFAEELGYRVIPDAQCPNSASCFSQFASGDLFNAFDYLNDPEATFLIAPRDSDDALTQRGAGWLFLRWAADHFSADTLLGTQFTRGMEMSTAVGADRVAQLTGEDCPRWPASGDSRTILMIFRDFRRPDTCATGHGTSATSSGGPFPPCCSSRIRCAGQYVWFVLAYRRVARRIGAHGAIQAARGIHGCDGAARGVPEWQCDCLDCGAAICDRPDQVDTGARRNPSTGESASRWDSSLQRRRWCSATAPRTSPRKTSAT